MNSVLIVYRFPVILESFPHVGFFTFLTNAAANHGEADQMFSLAYDVSGSRLAHATPNFMPSVSATSLRARARV